MEKGVFLSIVGARPNFIKLPPINTCLIDKGIKHVIVHTGQHYDYQMSETFFENLDIPKPDYNLEVGSGNPGYQLGEMIKRIEIVLLKEKPKVAITYGDTTSTIAGALAAAKTGFPVAHIEAGLRSFDRQMPEEVNRVLTDHVSDYLFSPTKTAMANLKKEHVWGKSFLTGDVMVETLDKYVQKSDIKSTVFSKLKIKPKNYLLVTIHRAENTENISRLKQIVDGMLKIERKMIFPIHPRTLKALSENNILKRLTDNPNIIITEPLGYLDFIKLEKNAEKILTDSGGVQKEAYLAGIPCITLRENTEWVETVASGWNLLVGFDSKKIVKAANEFNPISNRLDLFGKGNASSEIIRILSEAYL
jgi:UDP-N-acetylglucosamine 2-epimerase